jgi:hypothetical protein
MSNFRNVSKSEPCPICGKPDWCSVQYVEGNVKLHYCRRILNCSDVTSIANGMTYIFVKQTKDGSCMYKEESAYMESKKEWERRNGRNSHGSGRTARPKRNMPQPPPPAKPTPSVSPLDNRSLDAVYRAFLKKLHLQKNHVRYLMHERWPEQLILRSMMRSMPPGGNSCYYGTGREQITKELLRDFGSLKGVPGFYEQPNGIWSFSGQSGLLIPLYDHNGNLYRLRLRLDHPEVDENGKEKNKYHNFSSFYEVAANGTQGTNAFRNGCRSGSHAGLYAVPSRDDYTVCYITEEEKKAMYANYILRVPVISLPGVNSFGKLLEVMDDGRNVLNYLAARGCTTVIIAYDSDKYINEAVLIYEQKLVELLTGLHFNIAVAYWNPGFGKGLDDILSINVRPNYELVRV